MNILRLFFELCLHILYGTVLFCLVGGAAVGLGLFVHWAESRELASELVLILKTVEYVVFLVDILLYLTFIGIVGLEFIYAVMEIIRRRREGVE